TRIDPSQLVGITALCIDNESSVLGGLETLLRSCSCEAIKAPDLETALPVMGERPLMPNGLLVHYHLAHGNGIEAITELRRRFGDLPAILITADRSPAVREQAATPRLQLFQKPIKPAALRALLAQWRMMRAAAAE